jgi:PKD repeat protein
MKSIPRLFLFLLVFASIFFSLSTLGIGQANVSRSPSLRSLSPRITVDSAGNLHVVWAEYYSDTSGDAFYARYNISTDVWETPINLSNNRGCHSSEYRPVGIDVDGSDNIYVVYVHNAGTTHRLLLRVRSGGSWNSPFEVGTATDEIDSARIDVDPSGNIFTTCWTVNQGAVYSRARIGGSWEAWQRISPVGKRAKFPNIAVGNNNVFCCWQESGGPGYQIGYVRRNKSAGSSWSASAPVAPSSLKQQVPDIEIDGNDVAHMVFTPLVVTGGTRIVVYTRWTGSSWTSPQTISSQTLLHYPSIYERGNNIYVCWQLGAWGYGSGVNFNNRINGAWTGLGAVPNSKGASFTDVATSPSQNQVYYVWDDLGGYPTPGGTWEVYCNMGETGAPPPPPPPGAPVALFSYSPTSGSPPLTVSFNGSASYDSDGTITAYSWNFGDGASGSGAVVTHTYNSAGVFTARLTVTDNDGKSDSTSHTVNVTGQTEPNEPPVAEFSFSPNTGIYPLQVTFDAAGSRDPDGSIVQYNWDFGDGRTGSGRVVTHTYTRGGTFLIRLTVRDNKGSTATRSKPITVLTLRPPLNINWSTHADESLFQTRYVTEVTWERNAANDALGVQVVLYRIYRKKTSEGNNAYRVIGEVAGDIYRFMDKDAGANNIYGYTVTGLDNAGHESPLSGAAGFFSDPLLNKPAKGTEKQGKVLKF